MIRITITALVFLSLTLNAQKKDNWKEGEYYDKNGTTKKGLIYYSLSQSPKFRFKEDTNSKERKVKASEVTGFVVGEDKFMVLNNFKQDSRESAATNIPIDFVQVIETGNLTLYKHFGSTYSGGDSYSSTHGSSAGAGSSNLVETYIVKKLESGALWTIYSKPDKLKEQLLDLFQDDEVLLFKISQGKVQYSDLPELIKNDNKRFI